MDVVVNVVLIIIVLFFFFRLTVPPKGTKTMKVDELKSIIGDSNYQLIDVRTPVEFREHHIKGFKNIPMNEMKHRQSELQQDKKIVLICRSGGRSNTVARMLSKQGYENLFNVRGGVSAWKKKNK